jgi:hypothetical protein
MGIWIVDAERRSIAEFSQVILDGKKVVAMPVGSAYGLPGVNLASQVVLAKFDNTQDAQALFRSICQAIRDARGTQAYFELPAAGTK